MTNRQKAIYQTRSTIIKALAHPTRLFIIDQLAKKSYCVCELTAMVGDDITTISKHLSVLKNSGLVAVEKRGNQVFYRLKVPCVLGFLRCAEETLRKTVDDNNKTLKMERVH